MVQFDFERVKNPVSEQYKCEPKKGLDPITFTLAPVESDLFFLVQRWMLAQTEFDRSQACFDLGAARIIGWEGIQNAKGEPMEFSLKNKGLFLSLKEAMPYVWDVGMKTILSEVPEIEGKPKDESTPSAPEPTPVPVPSPEEIGPPAPEKAPEA